MNKGERYTKAVTLVSWGPGQSPRTAQYGAEFEFKTEDGELLYWDTISTSLDNTKGAKYTISFKVVCTPDEENRMFSRGYEVSNVRLVKNK
ncbi:hypothetical protein CN918_29365 [Priestia megaterium]|nr:hypothetical protein CN918_29365 [Priestia megaterium]